VGNFFWHIQNGPKGFKKNTKELLCKLKRNESPTKATENGREKSF
jgi:hypothetical protein